MPTSNVVLIKLVFLFVIVNAEYFANLSPTANCTGPRIRKAYTDLTDREIKNYINSILRMKDEYVIIGGKNESLYDFFTLVHHENSCSWHSSSFFFPVHRYFLWKFESALQYVARAYGSTFNPPITDPCSITIPYWNWEMNYKDMGKSPIFNSKYFGPSHKSNKNDRITSGAFRKFTCPYMKFVKRSFESRYSQTSGIASLVSDIKKYPDYKSYSKAIYSAHTFPHNYVNQQMASMYSPGDPIFWSHHSNIDRLWAIWQDCYDYEQYINSDKEDFPSILYTPYGSAGCDISYDLDSTMPFYYKEEDSFIFPKDEWPTPFQAYFMGDEGSPGFDDMYYRYGSDFIAEEFISGAFSKKRSLNKKHKDDEDGYCVANKVGWKLVNYGAYKKRALSNAKNIPAFRETLEFLELQTLIAEQEGFNVSEALDFIALMECQSTESRDIDPGLMAWIAMEKGDIGWYDRSCDNTSARFCQSYPSHELCTLYDEVEELLLEAEHLQIIAGIEGFIIILLLVFGGVCYFIDRHNRHKKVVREEGYVEMTKT